MLVLDKSYDFVYSLSPIEPKTNRDNSCSRSALTSSRRQSHQLYSPSMHEREVQTAKFDVQVLNFVEDSPSAYGSDLRVKTGRHCFGLEGIQLAAELNPHEYHIARKHNPISKQQR